MSGSPSPVERAASAAFQATRTSATVPPRRAGAALVIRPTAPFDAWIGAPGVDHPCRPDVAEHRRWMPEVADLRHGLLSQEAALRHVDEPLQAGLGRKGPGVEVDAHPWIAASDTPQLVGALVHRHRSAVGRVTVGGVRDDLLSRRHERRRQRPGRILQRHRRRQDVRAGAGRRRTPPGRSPAGRGTSRHRCARSTCRRGSVPSASAAANGRDDPVRSDAMSAVTRSPSHRRASAPRTCSMRSDERSTDAAPVIERVHLLPRFGRRGRHGP